MENQLQHPEHKRSVFGSFGRGFLYTAITGGVMGGILIGLSSVAAVPAIAGLLATVPSWAVAVGTVALATGLFGGMIQAISAYRAHGAATRTFENARDVEITAVTSHMLPQVQQTLGTAPAAEQAPELAVEAAPQTTKFRDMVANRESVEKRLNGILSRDRTSQTERLQTERQTAPAGQSL